MPPPSDSLPKTGSNLPPSLWLPLVSLAFVCLCFVSFRRAGASALFDNDSWIGGHILRRRGGGQIRLPTHSTFSPAQEHRPESTPPSPSPTLPNSTPLLNIASNNRNTHVDLPSDDDDDDDDILPSADQAAQIDREGRPGLKVKGVMTLLAGRRGTAPTSLTSTPGARGTIKL